MRLFLSQFEKNADGFEIHIKRDHHLWDYIYFIYYVKTKDPTEYNGIESFVAQQITKDDISFFPLLKAMVLHEDEENVDVQKLISEEIQNIESKIDEILQKVEEKENK